MNNHTNTNNIEKPLNDNQSVKSCSHNCKCQEIYQPNSNDENNYNDLSDTMQNNQPFGEVVPPYRRPNTNRPGQPPSKNRPPQTPPTRPPGNNLPDQPPFHGDSSLPPEVRPPFMPTGQRPPFVPRPPAPQPPPAPRPPAPRPPVLQPTSAIIHNLSFKRDFNYDNQVVLSMQAEYPQVFILTNTQATNRINNNINRAVNSFIQNNVNNLFPQAIENYLNQIENGYPLIGYESVLDYTTTYNKNCTLSMFYDNYTFTAGAHGNTIRKSDTYSLKNGSIIPLKQFFRNARNYKNVIIEEMIRQARQNVSQGNNIYFDDYETLIRKNFNEESFYLNNDGIVIYYQQYDIAPYSSGIIEFIIPYRMVPNLPKC